MIKKLLLSSIFLFNFSCAAISNTEDAYYYYVVCKYASESKDYESALELCDKARQELPDTKQIYKDEIFIALRLDKTEKVEQLLEEYINRFNKPEDYIFVANTYYHLRKIDKAISVLEEGLKKYPNNLDILSYLADFYIKNGKIKKAENILKEITKHKEYKKLDKVYYILARIELSKGNIKKAIEYLEKSFKLNKKNPEVYVLLGELYREQGNYKRAEEIYKQVLAVNPKDYEALNRLFQIYVDTDQYEKAKEIINDITKLYPSSKDSLLKEFLLYLKLGQVNQIIQKIENIAKKYPDDLNIQFILGMAYESLKEYKKAEEIYKKILKKEPKNEEVLNRLVSLYVQNKEYDKAIDILNEAYSYNPDNYHILVLMAEVEDERGNTKEAIKLIKEALEINSQDPKLYFYLAIYYDKLNKWKDAEKALKKALDIRPNYSDALNYLGYSYIVRNIDIDKGIELVKKALKFAPENPAYLDSLAWGYYKKGKYQEALKYMLKAYQQIKDDPVVLYHYGAILEAIGEKKKAKEMYEKALNLLSKMKEEPEKGITMEIKKRLKSLKW
ncbi:tetratricopeptide repeat protein [Hydrogenothermus marinus]|uniref:Tetratricopeptide repeat protein n=1 Tax=Hydrogenothermus marinus TaxID=133270 RepID=A0A3M0BKD9_9AQUI|nr:tetratricopeptide repeat protein [Hydrogenothermus marinus]RMA97933.1 tetratricopeptide repeat protein [Hydrogenothermus marinus]